MVSACAQAVSEKCVIVSVRSFESGLMFKRGAESEQLVNRAVIIEYFMLYGFFTAPFSSAISIVLMI